MGLMKAYSFLGRSTGILGHDNINNKNGDEGKDEGLGVNINMRTSHLCHVGPRVGSRGSATWPCVPRRIHMGPVR